MSALTSRFAVAGAPVLLAIALTSCGGGGAEGAPEDASKDEFCTAFAFEPEEPEDFDSQSEDERAAAIKGALREIEEKLTSTGTPEDIPEDARAGFEVILQASADLDESDIQDAIQAGEDPFAGAYSPDEEADVDAFDEWSRDYCG